MTILVLVICIILAIIFAASDIFDDYTPAAGALIGAGISFIVIIILISCLFYNKNVLPQKIQMYEEENADIEKKIANTVEKYMQYEKEVMIEVSPEDDVITLIALYPELKADELVKAEMDVYIENNKKIKEMKSKQLRIPLYKFLIFFGH